MSRVNILEETEYVLLPGAREALLNRFFETPFFLGSDIMLKWYASSQLLSSNSYMAIFPRQELITTYPYFLTKKDGSRSHLSREGEIIYILNEYYKDWTDLPFSLFFISSLEDGGMYILLSCTDKNKSLFDTSAVKECVPRILQDQSKQLFGYLQPIERLRSSSLFQDPLYRFYRRSDFPAAGVEFPVCAKQQPSAINKGKPVKHFSFEAHYKTPQQTHDFMLLFNKKFSKKKSCKRSEGPKTPAL